MVGSSIPKLIQHCIVVKFKFNQSTDTIQLLKLDSRHLMWLKMMSTAFWRRAVMGGGQPPRLTGKFQLFLKILKIYRNEDLKE